MSALRARGRGKGLAILMAWGLGAALRSAEPLSAPPPIPGGFTDAQGTQAFLAVSGGVEALDLATGRMRWRSCDASWPLASQGPWVAAALMDGGLRLRFLRTADGGKLAETK